MRFFIILLLSFVVHVRAAEFLEMTPSRGTIGTQVLLSGRGFNPSANNSIRVNGTLAAIQQITTTNIRYSIQPGTTSGNVVLNSDGATFTNAFPFRITRSINGELVLPRSVSPNGYQIISGNAVITPNSNGLFSVVVPLDAITTLWAIREENDPPFLTVLTPSTPSAIFTPRSTALGLAFISPSISTRNALAAESALQRLSQLPEVETLTRIIEAVSGNGINYLNDARIQTALANLVSAFLNQPAPQIAAAAASFKPGTPRFTFLRDLDPDITGTPLTLESKLFLPIGPNTNDFQFDLSPQNISYQDWLVEWFELDPEQFGSGLDDVLRIAPSDTPRKLSRDPFAQGFVRANLPAGNADLLGHVGNFLNGKIFPASQNDYSPNDFFFDREVPAIYISQAYSGNIWYGTSFFSSRNINQVTLLERLNAMDKWERAHVANCIIAALDLAGAAIDLEGFLDKPGALTKIIFAAMIDVEKTIQTHRGREGLSYDEAMDIITSTTKSVVQNVISEGLEGGLGAILGRFGRVAGNCMKSVFDVTGKLANVGQSFERAIGLIAPSALAIERSVVVIGHPFDPVIQRFFPTSGRGGDLITIEGYNFPNTASEVKVSFATFASTANPDVPTATLPATVVSSNPNALAILVPTNWSSFFPAGKAFISIETTEPIANKKLTTTIPLPEPYREFNFISPPGILDINPKPVAPGGKLSIHGTNFDSSNPGKHRVIIDGTTQLTPELVFPDLMIVTIGNLAEGSHTAAVKIGTEAASPTFPFTVQLPPGVPPPANTGLTITISKLDYSNNAEDGEISILEAFLICRGTLGRAIREHDDCEFLPPEDPGKCPFRPREIDWITGLGGGANSVDTIIVRSSLQGQAANGTANLVPGNGDNYNLGGIILGMPLIFDGVHGVTLRNVVLERVTGHGLHIRNGSSDNVIEVITINTPSGHGVFFDQDATNNRLLTIKVRNAGQHGLYLSGANVKYNVVAVPGVGTTEILGYFDSNGGNGVRLDNGASFNRVHPSTVRSNGAAGILITGATTTGNLIGRPEGSLPRSGDTYYNNGPGVHLTAGVQRNVVRYVNPSGNNGPGVLLEGPDCAFNQLDGIQAGMDYFTRGPNQPIALPNQGAGIHLRNGAHHNLIGSLDGESFGGRSIIGGNRDDGILLEGPTTAFNTINRCHIGYLEIFQDVYGPNGQNGIRIRNGSHHNVLGALWSFHDLHIVSSTDAGILIEGEGTDHNQIIGNQIGGDHGFQIPMPIESQNRIGIHIRDQAKANVIGQMGDELFANGRTFRFRNSIVNSKEAGIVLENCGGSSGPNNTLINPNIVQNNKIGEEDHEDPGPNEVGILIKGNAWGNMIGGKLAGQGNIIVNNIAAGIRIDSNVIPPGVPPNSIIRNYIYNTGDNLPIPANPLTVTPGGIGIHIRGNSRGNWIGIKKNVANEFYNNLVGIYIDSSSQNTLVGNEIYDSFLAGIILRNSSSNKIGNAALQGNVLVSNGANGAQEGGLVISGGGHNEIQSNSIGDNTGGNYGVGIYLTNSAANRIGTDVAGNDINRNWSHGIHVTGPGSTGNKIQRNDIGHEALAPAANLADGIRIDGGASGNLVGGMMTVTQFNTLIDIPAPNNIRHNSGAGVRVTGTTSTGNSILNNSITANGDLGIITSSGGNFEIPPPVQLAYDGAIISGNVDVSRVPAGSTIQIFFDPDPLSPEGDQWVGDATVLVGGAWSTALFANPAGRRITMTSTHAANRSTSQFGTATALQTAFTISRVDNTPTANVSAGSQQVPALRLALTTLNLDVLVSSVKTRLTGSLSSSHISQLGLYHDLDANGIISSGDDLISNSATNVGGEITFSLTNTRISPNTSQQWIIGVGLLPTVPMGSTFSLSLSATSNVLARIGHSAGPFISASGNFPINSATFTVSAVARTTIASWRQQHFTQSQLQNSSISGDAADANGNGIINLLEYAFNMDPIIDESGSSLDEGKGIPRAEIVRVASQDYFAIRYLRRRSPSDVDYSILQSENLPVWQSQIQAPSLFQLVDQEQLDEEIELISIRSTIPISNNPKQFLRVGVTLAP